MTPSPSEVKRLAAEQAKEKAATFEGKAELPAALPSTSFPPTVGRPRHDFGKVGGLPDPTEMIKQRDTEPHVEPGPSTEALVSKWLEEALATAPPPHQEHPARHLRERLGALVASLARRG